MSTMLTRRTFLYETVSTMALIALPFMGCRETEPSALPSGDCSESSRAVEAEYLFILFLDRTGSFLGGAPDRAAKILEESANVALRMQPRTIFVGRYLSDRSYTDSERFLDGAIPGLPTVDCSENPFEPKFDPHCREKKHQGQARAGCADLARRRIADKLRSLNPQRASKSDLWGGMWAISNILKVYPKSQRGILIYSDLEDNVSTRLPTEPLPGFKGTKVVVRESGTQDPKKVEELRAAFAERLSRWGATVSFIPLEVPMDLEGIFRIERS